jgi:WD40 repeat protein
MVMGESSASESSPVEQVLMFPSGTVALSSAGPIIRVWDIVAGGRCTRAVSNHQKTVTSMVFGANASRVLTGGLDQMVKVYDVSNFKVVHTMRYPAPILCLAISVCLSIQLQGSRLIVFFTHPPLDSQMRHIWLLVCQMVHFLFEDDREKETKQPPNLLDWTLSLVHNFQW